MTSRAVKSAGRWQRAGSGKKWYLYEPQKKKKWQVSQKIYIQMWAMPSLGDLFCFVQQWWLPLFLHYIYTTVLFSLTPLCSYNDTRIGSTPAADIPEAGIILSNYRVGSYFREIRFEPKNSLLISKFRWPT